MSRGDRAKQFAPFDAMRGLREALKRKEEERERCERKELSEERVAEIEQALCAAQTGDVLQIIFYHEGKYACVRGELKGLDPQRKTLSVEDGKISFRDLYSVEILS